MDAGHEDMLAYLCGTWRVRRRVVDHRAGQDGDFAGEAWFRPDGETRPALIYEERGELRLGGQHWTAGRLLRFLGRADRRVDVRFADGRHFYLLDAHDGGWSARHPCAADDYTVVGTVSGPDRFEEHWRAHGPTKDFELMTDYTRVR